MTSTVRDHPVGPLAALAVHLAKEGASWPIPSLTRTRITIRITWLPGL
jgi:hypothetical protein